MRVKTIGIVGRGAFGTFLRDRVESFGFKVASWDKAMAENSDPLDTVLESDVVIFAVPPKAYSVVLEQLVPRTRIDAVIVDVCTVKMATVEVLRRVSTTRSYIATHPMFGPQSFIDRGHSLKDLQLVICEHNLRQQAFDTLLSFLRTTVGLDVVMMTSEEHDRLQASEQLLTQYIGCVIGLTGFALNEHRVHTVSARHFYHAMAIVGADAELFKQAAALNPFWPEVLAQFELALAKRKLEMLNGTGSP